MSDLPNLESGMFGSDSLDAEILIVDGPGDNTERPPRPLLRKFGEAERERIARWQRPQDTPAQTKEQPDGKDQPGAGTAG